MFRYLLVYAKLDDKFSTTVQQYAADLASIVAGLAKPTRCMLRGQ